MEANEFHGPKETAESSRYQGVSHSQDSAAVYKQWPPPILDSVSQKLDSECYLPLRAALRIHSAVTFGAGQWSTWHSATINLSKIGSINPVETMRALTDHTRKWQERNSCPAYYVWVREHGEQHGDHAHALISIPTGHGQPFSKALQRWTGKLSIDGSYIAGSVRSQLDQPPAWLRYALKTLSPSAARLFKHLTGIAIYSAAPQAELQGTRVGIARLLAPTARRKSELGVSQP